MKKTFVRVALEVHNEQELDNAIGKKQADALYTPLLRLLAQALDDAAGGNNTWVSFGRTQDGSSLVLAVHTPDGKLACYGPTLGGLAMGSADLL